ncbi:MAG: recombinase family protein [Clostridia bacterium]|nr:recombinase family protein [Clostridia bacterium]
MANIKYIRVSTKEQNTARQEQDKAKYDKVYIEKISGKDTNRPQLQAMLDYVREGDVVTVESYSRLARDTRDLLNIIDALNKKGVAFVSQKEQIDTSTPAGRFMLSVFASLAQFEREQILARQAEGIAIAKREGRMGRPEVQPCDNFTSIVKDWQAGNITAVEAMKQAGMTKATFYRKVKTMNN